MTKARAVGRAFGLLLVGAVVGLIGAFLQASRLVETTPWGQVIIPWGLVFVIIVLVVTIRGGAWAGRSRIGAWAVFVGWLLATIAMAGESPSGDLALSGGARQWAYLLAGVILGAAAATFPVFERRSHTINESTVSQH